MELGVGVRGPEPVQHHWIIAGLMNASDDRTPCSRSLLSRRQRPSQANVRSTVQRIGSRTQP